MKELRQQILMYLGSNVVDVDLARREPNPDVAPDAQLPDDTRLWAALIQRSGGVWAGCVYDVEAIVEAVAAHGEAREK